MHTKIAIFKYKSFNYKLYLQNKKIQDVSSYYY